MAKCKVCGEVCKNVVVHTHEKHPEVIEEWRQKGVAAHRESAARKQGAKHKEKTPQLETKTPEIAGISGAKPAAVMFRLGDDEIVINPKDLFQAYLLYLDMREKRSLTDSFSTVMLDSVGLAWRLVVPQIPGDNGNGNGHKEEKEAAVAVQSNG